MSKLVKQIGNERIEIVAMKMPNRKKMCLAVGDGKSYTKYATFNNDEAVEEFMEILAKFVGVEE